MTTQPQAGQLEKGEDVCDSALGSRGINGGTCYLTAPQNDVGVLAESDEHLLYDRLFATWASPCSRVQGALNEAQNNEPGAAAATHGVGTPPVAMLNPVPGVEPSRLRVDCTRNEQWRYRLPAGWRIDAKLPPHGRSGAGAGLLSVTVGGMKERIR